MLPLQTIGGVLFVPRDVGLDLMFLWQSEFWLWSELVVKQGNTRLLSHNTAELILLSHRAVRYDDIYRMDEIKSLSFHIMFYRGVAKYIVSGKTFSSFE